MANTLTSNVTRRLARVFLKEFEANRVLTKTVDTQLLTGRFNPSSGTTVDFKRPHDYITHRTTAGDISGATTSDLIAGKATGTVQQYFTVATDWSDLEAAVQMDQEEQILAPMARRLITDLELDLAAYMAKNANLSYGSVGTVVDAWADVAGAGSLMNSVGVPSSDPWYYACQPFTNQNLAATTYGVANLTNRKVDNAFDRAMISENYGGFRVMASNCLPTRTVTTAADLAGVLAAAPDATYATHKDSMQQSLSVSGFTASAVVKAGDIVEITGKTRRSQSSRQIILDQAGTAIKWRATVTADVTLSSAGAGTIVVSGPAIYEANGQYNNVSAALAQSDVITILGTSGATVQPNLFYHPQAFGLGTVKLAKLNGWDTIATTEDGFSIRVTRYSDGGTAVHKVRFDLLPAYATFNPFFAGQGFGLA